MQHFTTLLCLGALILPTTTFSWTQVTIRRQTQVAPAAPAIPTLRSLQPVLSEHVRLDAFGYLPLANKVCLLREALVGFDAPDPYTSPAILEVRRVADGTLAFSGPAVAWSGGTQHDQSGDRVWWFDFSALQTPGTYAIVDSAASIVSQDFRIADDVYHEAARHAVRAFYYQRCGTPKDSAYAGSDWADPAPCHVGPLQDLACRSILNPTAGSEQDLSGGWHDAGDYNKYMNYTAPAVHGLLEAYELAPLAWGDDFGIPESGNGVPDLLDEIRVELLWALRMQQPDGSLLHKVSTAGIGGASPPSQDAPQRYYAPPSASATASGCSIFAHAAVVYGAQSDPSSQALAASLQGAAIDAWNWLVANPGSIPSDYDNQGFLSVPAEIGTYEQEIMRLRASVHLFQSTGNSIYRDWFDSHYQLTHLFLWGWASPWEDLAQEALLSYMELPSGTPAVQAGIRSAFATAAGGSNILGALLTSVDAYRAFLGTADYTWGSNSTKAAKGELLAALARFDINPTYSALFQTASADFLHYLHGANPLGMCFLTHMDEAGAERSPREIYHAWFAHGTPWDNADLGPGPPPGFVPGGVNPNFAPDPLYSGPALIPPMGQPAQKAYLDWNADWPENSWTVTEPAIGYQADYIRLIASFL